MFAVLDVQLTQLLLRDFARRPHHQIEAATIFRECDHVPDIGCACDQHHESIDAERNSTMGRRTEPESFQEVPEQFLLLLRGNSQHLK